MFWTKLIKRKNRRSSIRRSWRSSARKIWGSCIRRSWRNCISRSHIRRSSIRRSSIRRSWRSSGRKSWRSSIRRSRRSSARKSWRSSITRSWRSSIRRSRIRRSRIRRSRRISSLRNPTIWISQVRCQNCWALVTYHYNFQKWNTNVYQNAQSWRQSGGLVTSSVNISHRWTESAFHSHFMELHKSWEWTAWNLGVSYFSFLIIYVASR